MFATTRNGKTCYCTVGAIKKVTEGLQIESEVERFGVEMKAVHVLYECLPYVDKKASPCPRVAVFRFNDSRFSNHGVLELFDRAIAATEGNETT